MNSKHRNGYKAELNAAQYFIDEGYILYWPVGITASCIDFVAVRNAETLRVQVKCAYWLERKTGQRYLQCTTRKGSGGSETYSQEDCDVIAIVHENDLWVIPVDVAGQYQTINLDKGQYFRKSRKDSLDVSRWKVRQ